MDKYREAIQRILDDGELTVDRKLEKLEELYGQKPVRVEWFLAKAKLTVEKERKRGSGYTILSGKMFWKEPADKTAEVQEFLAELDLMGKDEPMAACRRFQAELARDETEAVRRARSRLRETEGEVLQRWEEFLPLANRYLACHKCLSYLILRMYALSVGQDVIPSRVWMENQSNVGYLKEAISGKRPFVILSDSAEDWTEAAILGRCLAGLGCPVYLLNPPGQIEVDAPVAPADTVSISMENGEELYGFTLIPTVELTLQGKSLGDNRADVVAGLCREENVVVIASCDRFEALSRAEALGNGIDNLYGYETPPSPEYFAFGWAGSYVKYLDSLYGMDTKAVICGRAQCRFSVVIPVRNSAGTLQHTLKTCLNQRYQGDYEVVISDNSVDGNTEVYQFCQTVTDGRVRYCRTPRDLRLSRSFEYAFLQARGEYVMAIGADDALFPWTLEVWDRVIERFPGEEVFLWDRGYYVWPEFKKGQQDKFIIPGRYEKDQVRAGQLELKRGLQMFLQEPGNMYLLPMLYINSGFRRSFLGTLLEGTGRLWDGICQDVYMGVVVSALKEKCVRISYPLAMAGMSSGSEGARANSPIEDQGKGAAALKRRQQENNVGGFAKSGTECLMPEFGTDVTSFYNSVLRAVQRGLLPREELDVFDWKQWFLNSYRTMDKKDVYYEKKIHQMRYAAEKHGDAFVKWFDETIYREAMKPVAFPKEEAGRKTYREEDNGEWRVLDASKYGVQNSYDASLLFQELTGL